MMNLLKLHQTYPAKLFIFIAVRLFIQLKETKIWENQVLGLEPGLNSPE